jgi:U11/U12 small nuclear ribonucleoprotein 65 kDa protein
MYKKASVVVEEPEPDVKTEISTFITKDLLDKNKMDFKTLSELSVFKNYDKGEPNSRLYIKNIAKKVTNNDLKYIFGSYINWSNEIEVNSFDIRYMTQGRMKGQAFITLPNENIASIALNQTNGYILNDKPLIVQFARSAVPKIN